MSLSNISAERRLERLRRLLAGRQTRLARRLASQQEPLVRSGPLDDLRRFGYPVAILLVATAVMPMIAGVAWRRRKLLFGAASNGVGLLRLRARFNAARSDGSGR